jgi:hypothetical protein
LTIWQIVLSSIDSAKWRYYQPDFILDLEKCRVWRVGVDLGTKPFCLDIAWLDWLSCSAKIALSFGSKERLVSFLIRRQAQGSRRMVANLLRSTILEGGPLSLLAKLFDVINKHNQLLNRKITR